MSAVLPYFECGEEQTVRRIVNTLCSPYRTIFEGVIEKLHKAGSDRLVEKFRITVII